MWGGGLSEEAFQGYVRAAAGLADLFDHRFCARAIGVGVHDHVPVRGGQPAADRAAEIAAAAGDQGSFHGGSVGKRTIMRGRAAGACLPRFEQRDERLWTLVNARSGAGRPCLAPAAATRASTRRTQSFCAHDHTIPTQPSP